MSDFVVGVIASLIATTIGFAAGRVFRRGVPRATKLLLWGRLCEDLVVLISEVPYKYDPVMRKGRQPPLTPFGDALSLAHMVNFLRTHLRAEPLVTSIQSEGDLDRFKDQNLLIIGGPKYNLGAATFLRVLDSDLVYQYRRIREPTDRRKDDLDMKVFVGLPPKFEHFQVGLANEMDYGMVVIAPNPFNSRRMVVLLGGLSPLSTLAASKWILSASAIQLFSLRDRSVGIQVVVSCRDVDSFRVTDITTAFKHSFHLKTR